MGFENDTIVSAEGVETSGARPLTVTGLTKELDISSSEILPAFQGLIITSEKLSANWGLEHMHFYSWDKFVDWIKKTGLFSHNIITKKLEKLWKKLNVTCQNKNTQEKTC